MILLKLQIALTSRVLGVESSEKNWWRVWANCFWNARFWWKRKIFLREKTEWRLLELFWVTATSNYSSTCNWSMRFARVPFLVIEIALYCGTACNHIGSTVDHLNVTSQSSPIMSGLFFTLLNSNSPDCVATLKCYWELDSHTRQGNEAAFSTGASNFHLAACDPATCRSGSKPVGLPAPSKTGALKPECGTVPLTCHYVYGIH